MTGSLTIEDVVDVDDVSLWTSTEGSGEPLVLCHGGPGLWDDLAPVAGVIRDLATVHRYDQRGGGRSTGGPPYTVSGFVDDLEVLRRHWGHERWAVGGHSWGASLALAYAARYPKRVSGVLYLSGTGLGWKWHDEYQQELNERLGEIGRSRLSTLEQQRSELEQDSDGLSSIDREICRIKWSTDFSDMARAPELVEELIDERFSPSHEVNRLVTEDWKRLSVSPGFQDAVSRLECPVLVVHGSRDPRPVWAVEDLAESLPDARLVVIQGVGHFPWLEAPERFATVARSFFSR